MNLRGPRPGTGEPVNIKVRGPKRRREERVDLSERTPETEPEGHGKWPGIGAKGEIKELSNIRRYHPQIGHSRASTVLWRGRSVRDKFLVGHFELDL